MLPIVGALLAQGLNLLGNAALVKGKEWIQEKTGVDVGKANLSNEEFTKLRQFEMEHEEELLRFKLEDDRLSAEIEKAYLADVDSARNMQVAALQNDDVFSKRFIYYFAGGWSLVTAVYLLMLTVVPIPDNNLRTVDTILGFLMGTVVSQILNFFFGSSRSSQKKDDVIKELTK